MERAERQEAEAAAERAEAEAEAAEARLLQSDDDSAIDDDSATEQDNGSMAQYKYKERQEPAGGGGARLPRCESTSSGLLSRRTDSTVTGHSSRMEAGMMRRHLGLVTDSGLRPCLPCLPPAPAHALPCW